MQTGFFDMISNLLRKKSIEENKTYILCIIDETEWSLFTFW